MNSSDKQTTGNATRDGNGIENPYTGEWLPNVCGRPGASVEEDSAAAHTISQAGPDVGAMIARIKAQGESLRVS